MGKRFGVFSEPTLELLPLHHLLSSYRIPFVAKKRAVITHRSVTSRAELRRLGAVVVWGGVWRELTGSSPHASYLRRTSACEKVKRTREEQPDQGGGRMSSNFAASSHPVLPSIHE